MPARFDAGQRIFVARIRRDYPVGSDERRLIADLTTQGFTISDIPTGKVAELHRLIACGDKVWRVDWEAETRWQSGAGSLRPPAGVN
jgi:hypothetical protein